MVGPRWTITAERELCYAWGAQRPKGGHGKDPSPGSMFPGIRDLIHDGAGDCRGKQSLPTPQSPPSYPCVPKWGKWEMGKNVYLLEM